MISWGHCVAASPLWRRWAARTSAGPWRSSRCTDSTRVLFEAIRIKFFAGARSVADAGVGTADVSSWRVLAEQSAASPRLVEECQSAIPEMNGR